MNDYVNISINWTYLLEPILISRQSIYIGFICINFLLLLYVDLVHNISHLVCVEHRVVAPWILSNCRTLTNTFRHRQTLPSRSRQTRALQKAWRVFLHRYNNIEQSTVNDYVNISTCEASGRLLIVRSVIADVPPPVCSWTESKVRARCWACAAGCLFPPEPSRAGSAISIKRLVRLTKAPAEITKAPSE